MAFLAAALPYLSTILGVAGGVRSAGASRKQGKQALLLSQMQARDMERQAVETEAIAQRRAVDQREQADLLISRAQALAAAGGGSATDPTVLSIIADIDGEGAYRAAMEMYQGERDANILRQEAQYAVMGGSIAKKEADAKADAYTMDAIGSLAKGATSMYDRYTRNNLSSGLRTT